MGRSPKTNIEQEVYHATKEELENRSNNLPVYKSQEFKAPKGMSEEELKIWDWLADVYRQTRNCMVTDCDIYLMENYCRDKVELEKAIVRYRQNPTYWMNIQTGEDKNGLPKFALKVNPDYLIIKDKNASLLKLTDQLGLSPLARARAGVKGANFDKEKNRLDSLVNRPIDE